MFTLENYINGSSLEPITDGVTKSAASIGELQLGAATTAASTAAATAAREPSDVLVPPAN